MKDSQRKAMWSKNATWTKRDWGSTKKDSLKCNKCHEELRRKDIHRKSSDVVNNYIVTRHMKKWHGKQ